MFQVIFDMDGVIFDSERLLLECWLDIARKYALDEKLVRNTYLRCVGTNSAQTARIYKNAVLDLWGEEKTWRMWDESAALHAARYPDGVLPMKPGVKELLEFLKSAGIPVGIASSTKKQTVDRRIGKAGLSGYFLGSIGGDSVTISKPDPEIYRLACRAFGFDPENTFAIEDSYNGIRSAGAAGLRPVMVPDLVPADAEMESLSEVVCKDLLEVLDYFRRRVGTE